MFMYSATSTLNIFSEIQHNYFHSEVIQKWQKAKSSHHPHGQTWW